jgi:molybdenum cofactor cytidylyltransferase
MRGPDKLLLPISGMPMVRRSALVYLELGMTLTVVTGLDGDHIIAALAGLDLALIANPDADSGQHTSVRTGLMATPLLAPGVIVALADQPLLTTSDIVALGAVFERHDCARICVPRHAGQRGNPVVFPAALARVLRDHPQAGLPRAFIDAHPEHVTWLEAENDHYTRDVDTRDDAAELLGLVI